MAGAIARRGRVGAEMDALSGPQKGAVLCMALGAERSARIMQMLSAREMETITREIAGMPVVSADHVSGVLHEFEQVSREHGKTLAELREETMLLESGLDSLCFAIVVVRIADALGVDPFSDSEDAQLPVTVGEFIKFYETSAAQAAQ